MKIKEFRSIVSKYEVVFFDAFGVIKTHHGLIEGMDKTFPFLKENNIDFYVLTNDASRSPGELAAVYKKMGVPNRRYPGMPPCRFLL